MSIGSNHRLLRPTASVEASKINPDEYVPGLREGEFNLGRGWDKKSVEIVVPKVTPLPDNHRLLRPTTATDLQRSPSIEDDTPVRRPSVSSINSEPRSKGYSTNTTPNASMNEEDNVFAAFAKASLAKSESRLASNIRASLDEKVVAQGNDEDDEDPGVSVFAAFSRRPSISNNIMTDINAFHGR